MNQYLQLILEWKMSKEEAFAFRLAILYIELSRKYFPDYKHFNLPKKGDPRKCELFKYCWKLMNTTKEKLKPEEYRYYIQSQMSILKNIKLKEGHPYIHPNCLVGETAWKRWCVWQKYFNQIKKQADTPDSDYTKEIKKALLEDHYALTVRFGKLTKEKLLIEMAFILRLYRMNVVSPYFLIMSSIAQEHIKNIDLELYRKRITEDSLRYYKKLFNSI